MIVDNRIDKTNKIKTIEKLIQFLFKHKSKWLYGMDDFDIRMLFIAKETKYDWLEKDGNITTVIMYQVYKKQAHAYYCGANGNYSNLRKLIKKIATKEGINMFSWINPKSKFKVMEV